MLKNLVIKNIPDREEDLKRLLKKIGDYSWNTEAIATFTTTGRGVIFYDKTIDAYAWSYQGNTPKDTSLVHKTFMQVMRV